MVVGVAVHAEQHCADHLTKGIVAMIVMVSQACSMFFVSRKNVTGLPNLLLRALRSSVLPLLEYSFAGLDLRKLPPIHALLPAAVGARHFLWL